MPSYSKALYETFRISSKYQKNKPLDLLRNSKQLILNTKRYHNYSNYYEQLTTTHSYKLPDLQDYPVQKNHCIISLRKNHDINIWKPHRKNLSCHSKDGKSFKNITIERAMLKTQDSELPTNQIQLDNTLSSNVNESSLLKFIDDFNNMKILYKYVAYKEKYAICPDKTDYTALDQYAQSKIITNELFEKPTIIENTFTMSENRIKVLMECNSMSLIFILDDIKEEGIHHKIHQEIKLPFEIIPMIYGLNFEDLKLFMSLSISYDKGKFTLNRVIFEDYYRRFKESKVFFLSKSLFNQLNKKEHYIQFDYPWITSDKIFKLTIKLPHYAFKLFYTDLITKKERRISIEKLIDSQHLIFYLKSQFKDWDLFLINAFSVYKDFRYTINQVLSFNPFKNPKKEIRLDHIFVKPIEDLSDSTWPFFYTNKDRISYYLKLHSMKIQIRFPENETRELKTFNNNLNIQRTKRALMISDLLPIEELLRRCMTLKIIPEKFNTETIDIDWCYDILDEIDEVYCNYIRFHGDNLKNYTNIKERDYTMSIIEPAIDWEGFGPTNQSYLKRYTLPKEAYTVLMNRPLREWNKYIQLLLPLAINEAVISTVDEDMFSSNQLKANAKRKKTSTNRVKVSSSRLVVAKDLGYSHFK